MLCWSLEKMRLEKLAGGLSASAAPHCTSARCTAAWSETKMVGCDGLRRRVKTGPYQERTRRMMVPNFPRPKMKSKPATVSADGPAGSCGRGDAAVATGGGRRVETKK